MSAASYKTPIYTDNDWRVTQHLGNIIWLEHLCESGPTGWKDWHLMWCDSSAHGRPCSRCDSSATPGLQAVFVFLKGA